MLAPPEKLLPAIDKVLGAWAADLATPKVLTAVRALLTHCRARIEADSLIPSEREELARKALTAAIDATHRVAVGLNDRAAGIAALAAIIETTSGLIPMEVTNRINDTLKELRQ